MSWLPTIIFALCIGLALEKAWHWKGRAILERALTWTFAGFGEREQ